MCLAPRWWLFHRSHTAHPARHSWKKDPWLNRNLEEFHFGHSLLLLGFQVDLHLPLAVFRIHLLAHVRFPRHFILDQIGGFSRGSIWGLWPNSGSLKQQWTTQLMFFLAGVCCVQLNGKKRVFKRTMVNATITTKSTKKGQTKKCYRTCVAAL